MRNEPCKCYGNLVPAGPEALQAVVSVCTDWGLHDCVELAGDILRISFEGVFFPQDEVIEALRPYLSPDSTGKIDCIDMENWRLTRAVFAGQNVRVSSAGLNDVLAYSGH